MKSILGLAIFASSLFSSEAVPQHEGILSSDEESKVSYFYLKLSDQWLAFPGLGLGYRSHRTHGFDVDLTAYTYWYSGYTVYGKAHYLFYPNAKGHVYVGAGAGIIGGALDIKNPFALFGRSRMPSFGLKPTLEAVFGYEWPSAKNAPCFLQLEAGLSYGRIPIYPVISFGLGF